MKQDMRALFLLISLARLEGLPHLPEARTSPAHPHASIPSLTLSLRGGSPAWGSPQLARPLIKKESEGAAAAVLKAAEKDANAGCMGTLSVVFYLLTSLTLTLMNKVIFTEFQFPLFVTEFQLMVSMAMLIALGEISRWTGTLSFVPPVELELSKAVAIAPVTALFVAMLASTNACLRHVDIAFYQVLRSTVIPMNILLNYLLLHVLPSTYASLCCVIVVAGFLVGSATQANFSRQGFVFGMLSSLLVALYSTSVKKILPLVDKNTWKLMHYTTMEGMILLCPLVFLSGEWKLVMLSPHITSPSFWLYMLEAAFAGFLINLAYFALIKFGSPLTTHVTGCSKTALQTLLGMIIFKNKVSPLNAGGIALALVGSTLYSMEKYLSPLAIKN